MYKAITKIAQPVPVKRFNLPGKLKHDLVILAIQDRGICFRLWKLWMKIILTENNYRIYSLYECEHPDPIVLINSFISKTESQLVPWITWFHMLAMLLNLAKGILYFSWSTGPDGEVLSPDFQNNKIFASSLFLYKFVCRKSKGFMTKQIQHCVMQSR